MKYFENLLKKTYFIIIPLVLASCEQKEILIKGNIKNLPDGIMYLSRDTYLNKIDSINTVNGKFTFRHNLENEPIYIALHHIDKKGVFRAISFPTEAKYNNSGYNSQFFLSDSIVLINGLLTDNTPVGMFTGNTKFVTTPRIIAGYQTNALFHTNGDLFDNINKNTYSIVLSKIKEYPNSFHLLYEINDNRNSFTPQQIAFFLNLFKGEIVDSDTFNNLKEYNEKRYRKKKMEIPLLKDDSGKKTTVLDNKFKKHLIIFWASWCGPCRQEIPLLKKMYQQSKDNVDFVSISIDTEETLWKSALDKEQMKWKQLIVNENSEEYEKIEILFQVSNSIPYLALVDENNNVIKSHVGLMTDVELRKFIND